MDNFNVKIEKLVYGGDGLAYHDGKPVFVPFVLPGEEVEVIPIEESRKLVRALPAQVMQAAEQRIQPHCPYFARCGGCHYQHLSYDDQLRLKVNILRETLRRLGKLDWKEEIPVHASPPWNYRNRVQLKLAPHPVVAEVLQVGYYRAGSHNLCAVEQCPLVSPKLNQLIAVFNRLSAARALPLSLRGAEAFTDDRDQTFWLTLSAPRIDFDAAALAETLRTDLDGLLSLQFHQTSADQRRTDGLGWTYWNAGAQRWRVSHQSFFQVNRHLVPTVIERATTGLEGKVALDLYAGVGLFTRALAEKFARVVAVEAGTEAAADLAANLADLEGVEAQATSVANFLRRSPEKCDVAVLDPSRTGLERGVAEALAELAPPRLVYLSCDPATFARDLARLAPHYRVSEIELFDLFPQTFHIEALARLERTA